MAPVLVALAIAPVSARQSSPPPPSGTAAVSALGRLEPEHGVRRIGAASTPYAVSGALLATLNVEEGDDVEAGQLLAVTDTAEVLEAVVGELEAELVLAKRGFEAATSQAEEACVRADVAGREAKRLTRLHAERVVSQDDSERAAGDADAQAAACSAARTSAKVAEAKIEATRARLRRAQAELERAYARAPMDGRVLEVLARPGERVGPDGILELGRVSRMYAIAEVYETDIGRVRIGQRATVESPALDGPLTGRVEKIHQKVQKIDEIGTDPAARRDARIVEVEILLDEPEKAASLTHLQVEIVIEP